MRLKHRDYLLANGIKQHFAPGDGQAQPSPQPDVPATVPVMPVLPTGLMEAKGASEGSSHS